MKNPVTLYFKRVHNNFISIGFTPYERTNFLLKPTSIYIITFFGFLFWLEILGINAGFLDFLFNSSHDFLEYTLGLFGRILWFLGTGLIGTGLFLFIYFCYCLIKSFYK